MESNGFLPNLSFSFTAHQVLTDSFSMSQSFHVSVFLISACVPIISVEMKNLLWLSMYRLSKSICLHYIFHILSHILKMLLKCGNLSSSLKCTLTTVNHYLDPMNQLLVWHPLQCILVCIKKAWETILKVNLISLPSCLNLPRLERVH